MTSHRPTGATRDFDPLATLSFVRGENCYLWDSHGQCYIDAISGYSTTNLGHCHPRLVAALCEQASTLEFVHAGQSPWRNFLESALAATYANSTDLGNSGNVTNEWRVWLSTTGARALEVAWKVASSCRPGKIARFDLAFHGRSIATASISDTDQVTIPGINPAQYVIPFPRTSSNADYATCDECQTSLQVATDLFAIHASQISCLVIEPAIGSRGYFFAPAGYFRELTNIARRFGVIVVSDEIQMGLHRLGSRFIGVEDGWSPDLTVIGKSLGAGITPIAAVIGRAEIMDKLRPGIESETYAASPIGCRIALEVLAILDEQVDSVKLIKTGDQFRKWLASNLPAKMKIDGRGFATCIDLSSFGDRAADIARNWVASVSLDGLLVHLTGPKRDRIAILPPLIMSAEMLEHCGQMIARSWKNLTQCWKS